VIQSVNHIADLKLARSSMTGTVGLVPTMGALHEGHLSLIARARHECDHVGVSIFVNPAQFGPGEDLNRYPRDLERDRELLAPLGVDLLWAPSPDIVYPPGFQSWISVDGVSRGLEGERRPGHFRGVATVVAKLFNLFAPHRAYFGQKDAQQLAVIRRMVLDLNFPIDIVACPTVRAADGLALSSRNSYLTPLERPAATVLFRALSAAQEAFGAGERNAGRLRLAIRAILNAEPLVHIDYISAADPETLAELEHIETGVLLSLAVRIGKMRLIDNILLTPGDENVAGH
jgi:pantoate--beta-alanine ligase